MLAGTFFSILDLDLDLDLAFWKMTWTRTWTCPVKVDLDLNLDLRIVDLDLHLDLAVAGLVTSLPSCIRLHRSRFVNLSACLPVIGMFRNISFTKLMTGKFLLENVNRNPASVKSAGPGRG